MALFERGLENNIYAQIGLVMLIGLSAKNAILIVEFARAEREKGKSQGAALEGARLRLRPILMTSFAFILGCVPLWVAVGAGCLPADHRYSGYRGWPTRNWAPISDEYSKSRINRGCLDGSIPLPPAR
jgi:hypothetical protein